VPSRIAAAIGWACCLGGGAPHTFVDDPETPASGTVFTYLVRARSALGVAGSFGTDSSGAARENAACL